MIRVVLGLLLLLGMPWPARAAAWTQAEDHWQIISGVISSNADKSFGAGGRARLSGTFRRALLQTYTEYGWKDGVTLFGATETAYVHVAQSGMAARTVLDNAFEGGARVRLDPYLGWGDFGVLSGEVSVRAAGAFNFAVSADAAAAGEGGALRLLYGRSFKWNGRDAFVDAEAGEEFLSGGRPDETPLDLTVGVWLNPGTMVMAQNFNMFGAAGRIAAYPAFRSHKVELSLVRRLSERFLVQAGAFFSPIGQNALVEEGFCLSLWTRF